MPATLLGLQKLPANDAYRADLLRHVENAAVLGFFQNSFDGWTSSFREEVFSPVHHKCRAFTTDPMMRDIRDLLNSPRLGGSFASTTSR